MTEAWHARLKGWRTILAARAHVAAGLMVWLHDIGVSSGTDLTPIIPSKYAFLLVFSGFVFELLRRYTNTEMGKTK